MRENNGEPIYSKLSYLLEEVALSLRLGSKTYGEAGSGEGAACTEAVVRAAS